MPASVTGGKVEEIEQKYDVVINFPNLELHSAAAEGNVGLVHYALTHGQPINSILHGLQPIHAAAAGGSLSAIRMLIDRGADVNAPRLPRRYSSEKNKDAPTVGVAGATPLHFAAANGHAAAVQLLLTNGAIPEKADQMGQTPEGLAEENGHGGVIDILRIYDSLRRPGSSRAPSTTDAVSVYSASIAGPSRPASPSGSVVMMDETEPTASRKGKERADSMNSMSSSVGAVAAGGGLGKMRKSIGGLLGRRSRKASLAMSPVLPNDIAERPDTEIRQEPPDNPSHATTATSDQALQTSPATSLRSLQDSLQRAEHALARTPSTASAESNPSAANPYTQGHPTFPVHNRDRKSSHSSRRPSLPSIFEKATHPGQAFRNVLRHHKQEQEQEDEDASVVDEIEGNRGFLRRGRQKSNEVPEKHGKRYMSKGSLIGLFRRPHSTPSRSPSPPVKDADGNYPAQTEVDPDELNMEIERLRLAQSGNERRHSFDEGDDGSLIRGEEIGATLPQPPKSAPAGKTRFFEQLDSEQAVRKPNRSRTGSEVIAPSPLANEWARESSDSDTNPSGIRRVRTESEKAGPSRLSMSTVSPRGNKQRSATLPSSPAGYRSPLRTASGSKLVGDLDEAADLRSGVLIRESVKKSEGDLSPLLRAGDAEEDEEVYHDASDHFEEAAKAEEPSTIVLTSPPKRRMRGASVGSINSIASRMSTAPPSSLRFENSTSDDNSSEKHTRFASNQLYPSNSTNDTSNRPRGKSVSSTATSGSGYQYSLPLSTPATSITPPSIVSITLPGSAFPPVPEDGVADHTAKPIMRQLSSREEVDQVVRRAQDDVLQLAQQPIDSNSTRDLAAQLAAFGESVALQEELSRQEKRYQRREERARRGMTSGTDSASWSSRSTARTPSLISMSARSESVMSAQTGLSAAQSHYPAPSLVSVEAPRSNLPNINTIYDRRAALYRENMAKLTTANQPRSLSHRPVHPLGSTPRSGLEEHTNTPRGPPAWLTGTASSSVNRETGSIYHAGGSLSKYRNTLGRPEPDVISSSLPHDSLPLALPPPDSPKRRISQKSPRKTGRTSEASVQPFVIPGYPTLATGLGNRPDGQSVQRQTSANPTSVFPASSASYTLPGASGKGRSVSAAAATTTVGIAAPSVATQASSGRSASGGPMSTSAQTVVPLKSAAPSVSIFNHRFTGPRDGGDSDDSEVQGKGYMVIENDWRGGKVIDPAPPTELGDGKRKWGLKGLKPRKS